MNSDSFPLHFACSLRFRVQLYRFASCTAAFHSRMALATCPCARRARPSFQCASAAVGERPLGGTVIGRRVIGDRLSGG